MAEINLLDSYPRSRRPIAERGTFVTAKHRAIARLFDKEFFDGDRLTGYGGYSYDPRFWQSTVQRFRDHYRLSAEASILDVGCGKGFMLHDFKALMPAATVAGVDISKYAIEHAMDDVRPFLLIADARSLPFQDRSFDVVISINTVHNLDVESCKIALKEIERVSRSHAFVTVDAWREELEREKMLKWNLTALTYMHVDDWLRLFADIDYRGDYFWFIAE